jgi:magnesium transporter
MQVLQSVETDRIRDLLDRDEFFWLDLVDPPPEAVDRLGDLIGLTDLARKDTKNFDQRPKVDDFGDHVLLVLYTAVRVPADPEREWRPLEVHVYVSGHWIVTVRRGECEVLAEKHEQLDGSDVRSEVRVLWHVLRALTDGFERALDEIEQRVDLQEARVFEHVQEARLADLYHLRQETNDLLRRAAAQRDVWDVAERRLCRLEGLEQDASPLMDDVGDQLVEVAGELERHHADASTLIDVYFSASGDRLNRIVTRLTVLATFFLAWTLVTGFFGQNFGWFVDNVIDSRSEFFGWGIGGLLFATVVAAVIVRRYGRSE